MRTSRLVALLLELTRARRSTVTALASRHGVSARTIQRDLAALQEMGVPVWTRTGPAGGVGLVEGWRSPLTGMTAGEMQALLLGEAGARELGLDSEFEAARLKMLAAPGAAGAAGQMREAVAERFHLDHERWFAEPEHSPALAVVAQAVWAGRRITVHYARAGDGAEPTQRLLDPLGLVLKADRWYLVAAHQGSVRTYRLSRIREAVAHEEPARRPEGFCLAEHWQSARKRFEASVVTLPVRLSIPSSSVEALRGALPGTEVDAAVDRARGQAQRQEQRQEQDGEGSRLEVSLLTEALEIVGTQLLAVPGAEVHEPVELRRMLAARGRDLVARHAPTEV